MAPVIFQQGKSAHDYIFLYNSVKRGQYVVQAIRHNQYKVHYWTKKSCVSDPAVRHNPPLLFDVEADPSEEYVNKKNRISIVLIKQTGILSILQIMQRLLQTLMLLWRNTTRMLSQAKTS